MRARDVMTTAVHTVTPATPILDVARLLVEKRISAAPVVDAAGRIVGIVSEGDLIRRSEIGTERHRPWLLRFLSDPQTLAADYVKSEGPTADAVMTRDVVTVGPDATLDRVAATMERHGIKRVPVVDQGQLVGIISRANLVQAIVAHGAPATRPTGTGESDAALRDRLVEKLKHEPWFGGPTFNVMVEGGVAHLWGFVRTEDERRAMVVAAQTLPGIRGVEDHLTIARWDFGV
ncbi:CBS domain-containing protein [Stella sp.]|uniref:CBS domain-containing protein n=1 Tax=Stella sp. TaxID=2912054 RepID=UPI0035AEB6CB